jgi:hypothetical protein
MSPNNDGIYKYNHNHHNNATSCRLDNKDMLFDNEHYYLNNEPCLLDKEPYWLDNKTCC